MMPKATVLVLIFFLIPLLGWSQTLNLPAVKVLGDKEEELLVMPGAATILTKERLKELKALSTQDAVKKTAGAHVIEAEGLAYIGMRGLSPEGSKKLLLLEDGAPLALGPYIDPSAYYTPIIERVERIDIRKGSSSLAFGPATVGGTVNYITKTPSLDNKTRATLTGGSREYGSLLVETSQVNDKTGFIIQAYQRQGNGNRENTNADIKDLMMKWGGAFSEKSYLGAKFSFHDYEAQRTFLGLTKKEYEADPFQNPAKEDMLYMKRFEFAINHDFQISAAERLSSLLYMNETNRDWYNQGFSMNPNRVVNTLTNTNSGKLRTFQVVGLDTRYFKSYGSAELQNDLQVGLRLHAEKMSNQEISGTTASARTGTIRNQDDRFADAQALYLENTLRQDNWTLTPGVRVERYRLGRHIFRNNNVDVNIGAASVNTETMWGLGGTYALDESTRLFSGVHQGFAPPRVEDSIDTSGREVVLDAERSVNAELGLRRVTVNTYMEVALFHLDFQNQILTASAAGASSSGSVNAGKTLHQGVEAALRYSPPEALQWLFDVNATYVPVAKLNSPRFVGTPALNREGNRLPYAPEYLANLGVGYKTFTWFAGLQYSYVSKQFADFENTEAESASGMVGELPAYGFFNLNADYQFGEDWELSLAVKNLTDEVYINSRAPFGIFPGLRRTAYLSLKMSY